MNVGTFLYLSPIIIAPLAIFGIFWSAAGIGRRFHLSLEVSRKLVHLIGGSSAAIALFLYPKTHILVGLVLVAILLALGSRARLFGGVVGERRGMLGPMMLIAAYALLLVLAPTLSVVAIAMLTLTAADAAAALAGKRWGDRKDDLPHGRTWIGSFAFAFSAYIVALAGLLASGTEFGPAVALALACALAGMTTEALAPSAIDNLLIPLVIAAILHIQTPSFWLLMLAGLGAVVMIATIARRLRWLATDGALAFVLLATVMIAADGWGIAILLLAFFVISSMLTRLRPDQAVQDDAAKGRRAAQVFALGAIPAGLAYCTGAGVTAIPLPAIAAAVVAAAAADTWATEIGRFSRRPPRLIWNGAKVQRGISGGVTALGLTAAAVGSALVAALAIVFHLSPSGLTIFALGFIGSLLDSVLGGTIQGGYRCSECAMVADTVDHCHPGSASLIRGTSLVGNVTVNVLMCIAVAAAAALLSVWGLLR